MEMESENFIESLTKLINEFDFAKMMPDLSNLLGWIDLFIRICVMAAPIAVLFFGGLGYLTFIRPYVIYRKLPEVLLETDGEFLYLHGKKEAKIPLSDISNVTVYTHVPHVFQPGFFREIIIHIFSSNYGEIELDIPGYGDYKLPFVANVEDVSGEVIKFLDENGNTGL